MFVLRKVIGARHGIRYQDIDLANTLSLLCVYRLLNVNILVSKGLYLTRQPRFTQWAKRLNKLQKRYVRFGGLLLSV